MMHLVGLTFIQNELKKELDEPRYQHTLGVMYTASAMAMCHGADLTQALTAGLLHDCAKCIPADEKIRMCKEHEIPVTDIEYADPGLLHAKLRCLSGRRKIRNLWIRRFWMRYAIIPQGVLGDDSDG